MKAFCALVILIGGPLNSHGAINETCAVSRFQTRLEDNLRANINSALTEADFQQLPPVTIKIVSPDQTISAVYAQFDLGPGLSAQLLEVRTDPYRGPMMSTPYVHVRDSFWDNESVREGENRRSCELVAYPGILSVYVSKLGVQERLTSYYKEAAEKNRLGEIDDLSPVICKRKEADCYKRQRLWECDGIEIRRPFGEFDRPCGS